MKPYENEYVGWIGNDGNVYQSYNEKSKADVRYRQAEEQLSELKYQNMLQERAIKEANENTDMIIKATKQAEEDRYQNNLELQERQQEFDKETRKIQLADKIGINYNNLIMFDRMLKTIITPKIQTQLDKINSIKVQLDEYKTPIQSNKTLEETNNAINQLILQKSELLKQLTTKHRTLLSIFTRHGIQNKIDKIDKSLEKLNIIKNRLKAEEQQNASNYRNKLETEIPRLESQLELEQQILEKLAKEYGTEHDKLVQEFTEYRQTHYNEDIENLFIQLDLHYKEVDKIKDGSVFEFNKFLQNKLKKEYQGI